MRNLLVPIVIIVLAIAMLFVPDYGVIVSILLLGLAPVLTSLSSDIIKFEVFKPDKTKLIYFLLTTIFPIAYSFFLIWTISEPELLSTLEPIFMGVWLALLFASFVAYYILACFLPSLMSKKRYPWILLLLVFYGVLAFIQVFSIEISYLFVIFSQP
jgi:hypothetical protein